MIMIIRYFVMGLMLLAVNQQAAALDDCPKPSLTLTDTDEHYQNARNTSGNYLEGGDLKKALNGIIKGHKQYRYTTAYGTF